VVIRTNSSTGMSTSTADLGWRGDRRWTLRHQIERLQQQESPVRLPDEAADAL